VEVNIPSFSYHRIDKFAKGYEIYNPERRAVKNDYIFIDIRSIQLRRVEVQTKDIDLAKNDPDFS
jgi:hypothetical protein